MKRIHRHIFYLFLIIFLFTACQSVKDGLTGSKKSNSDEFLIEKKNPLVLPPEFDKLPEPRTLSKKEKNNEKEIDLKAIIIKKSGETNSSSSSTSTDNNSSTSIEKSILKKIKKD
jgi:hypothetical protein